MADYTIRITRRAQKDIEKLSPRLQGKLKEILIHQVAVNPMEGKQLVGEMKGYWSVRLTYRDRILYRIDESTKTIYILRARTHYGD